MQILERWFRDRCSRCRWISRTTICVTPCGKPNTFPPVTSAHSLPRKPFAGYAGVWLFFFFPFSIVISWLIIWTWLFCLTGRWWRPHLGQRSPGRNQQLQQSQSGWRHESHLRERIGLHSSLYLRPQRMDSREFAGSHRHYHPISKSTRNLLSDIGAFTLERDILFEPLLWWLA